MIGVKWAAMGIAGSALLCGSAVAQTPNGEWNGSSSRNFNDPNNWSNHVVPDGSILTQFSPAFLTGFKKTTMDTNGVGSSVSGITVDASGGVGGNFSIIGVHALTIGSSGIAMNQSDNSASSMEAISCDLILGADQTWAITDSSLTVTGNVFGAQALTISNSGAIGSVTLRGNNTYSGGTTMTGNVLVVAANSSAFGSGAVTLNLGAAMGVASGSTIANQITVNDGSTVAGYGTIAPASPDTFTFQNGSVIVGGRGTLGNAAGAMVPGTLTFSNNASLVLGQNGTMQFSIMNATGTAGTDYSAISSSGTVNITATPAHPVTIQLVAVNSSGQFQLNSANFNNSTAYSWTLLSAGSSITGFTGPNQFNVDDTSDFQNPFLGGTFSVSDAGSSLMLSFTPVPEPATWILMAGGLCAAGAAVRRRCR